MHWKVALAALGLMLALSPPAIGQVIYNPTTILFDSPDHATGCPGTACVDHYVVEYWLQGVDPATGSPVSTATLLKAKVIANNPGPPAYKALLSDLTPLLGIPIGQTYVARVVAWNAGTDPAFASARSAPSNPFASAGAPRSPLAVSLK